jgi:PPP family 3-phenylpropionic acid transporter
VAACYVAFAAFESAFAPLSDAIAVNAVPDPRRDYARIRLLASLAFAVATIAAGFLYDRTGYGPAPLLFTLLAAAAVASAAVTPDVERADLHAIVALDAREPSAGQDRGRRRLPTWRLGSVGVALGLAPRLPAVLLAIGLIQVGIIGGFTFLAVRLQELGANPSAIALSSGISAAAEIPAFLVAGAVARRVGIRGLFAGSALLYSACFVSWMVIDVPALLIATRVFTGVSFAGISVAAVLTVAALLPDRLQATGQALYQTTAFGLAAIVANVAGGVVYGSAGPATVFGLAAAAGLAAVVVGWVVLPTRAAPGARAATGTTGAPH